MHFKCARSSLAVACLYTFVYACVSGELGNVNFAGNGHNDWCKSAQNTCWPQTKIVTFGPKFDEVPKMIVSVSTLDAGEKTGAIRVRVGVASVTKTEAHIKVNTWADSLLYSVRVQYVACN